MIEIVTRTDVLIRALKMASIVGVVLAIINHGDHILLGTMTATNWIKVLITVSYTHLTLPTKRIV